jgi:hypothetical protein
MREFFKGWRRKVGCVTLVMACVLGIGWGRSYFVEDRVAFTSGSFRYAIGTSPGRVLWDQWLNDPPMDGLGWSSSWRDLNGPMQSRPDYYKAPADSILGKLQFESRSVPYWPFAVPLTFLSGYLVLSKPRKDVPITHQPETPHA